MRTDPLPVRPQADQSIPEVTTAIETFRHHVRHALEHLYDADALYGHWLVERLGLAQQPVPSRELRQRLLAAIQQMRPAPEEPPDTPKWQMHQVLLQRYVQRISAEALADQLGMSSRSLRRLQRRALAQLSEILLQQTQGEQTLAAAVMSDDDLTLTERVKTVDDEIEWLHDVALSESVSIISVLDEVLHTLEPMVHQAGVDLVNHIIPEPEHVAIPTTGLRQVFLSVLTHTLQHAGSGSIKLMATSTPEKIIIHLQSRPDDPSLVQARSISRLVVTQRILNMFGGEVHREVAPNGDLSVRLSLIRAGNTPVLVIDDNPDALQLYARYVSGTRYRLESCQQPEQALEIAETLRPRVIIMDIMMPGLDGWSLLGRLRHHPATATIPVVICTIVSERSLALMLGAAELIQKPVKRATFLAALDRQLATEAPSLRSTPQLS
jgi:CheY-like chemotaxis protein